MTWGNALASRSAAKTQSGVRRTRLLLAPFAALLAVMAVTGVLGLNRWSDRAHEQAQFNEAARQEFALEMASASQHTSSEIDRLRELVAGITSFAVVSTDPPDVAVARYLELSGAPDRFAGFIEARVIPGIAEDTEADDGQLEGLRPDIEQRETLDPFVTQRSQAGQSITVVTAPLFAGTPPDMPTETDWVSISFWTDAFLGRAIAPNARLSTTLASTGLPSTATRDLDANAVDVPVQITDDGRLSAALSIDVFGSEYVIDSVSTVDFLQRADARQVWVILLTGSVIAFLLYGAVGSLVRSRSLALESAQSANQRSQAIDRRFRASFELAPIGMAEVDHAGLLVEGNPALASQAGRSQEDIVGRPLSMLVHESDRAAHIAKVESLLDGSCDAVQGEHRYSQPGGNHVWVHESISVIADQGGKRSLLVQTQDVTARRAAAWELAQQALHDELTGLPNRALFLNRLKHALTKANRENSQVAVMFIDIDRFKVVNDSLGHEMGDQFLSQISQRIGTAIRAGDTVARFGGDEFVVLCETVASESEAAAAAQRIQSAFSEPFQLGDSPTYATASIGISMSTTDECSADALLRDADAAMYRAKEGGRNRSEMFNNSMRSSMLAQMEIESQLRAALENGEIVMHYQAIVDPKTYLPAGYEALIRWNHPEKGLLGPAAFLPAAEEAGLIHLIDSFALRSTCNQIAAWVAEYPAARTCTSRPTGRRVTWGASCNKSNKSLRQPKSTRINSSSRSPKASSSKTATRRSPHCANSRRLGYKSQLTTLEPATAHWRTSPSSRSTTSRSTNRSYRSSQRTKPPPLSSAR